MSEYKELYSTKGSSGDFNFGLKIMVKLDREFTENDTRGMYRIADGIVDALHTESLRLDPGTHERTKVTRAEMINLFPAPIFVEEIPNGYGPENPYTAFQPWFVVTTQKGRIKIGWRRSVIHLEWTDSAIKKTAAEIFPKEEAWPGYETTQYDQVIHCHSYEKAREYIARLLSAETV